MEALPRVKQGPCAYAQVKAIHSIRENGTPTRTANKPSLRPLWVGQPPVSANKSLRHPSHGYHLAKKARVGAATVGCANPRRWTQNVGESLGPRNVTGGKPRLERTARHTGLNHGGDKTTATDGPVRALPTLTVGDRAFNSFIFTVT